MFWQLFHSRHDNAVFTHLILAGVGLAAAASGAMPLADTFSAAILHVLHSMSDQPVQADFPDRGLKPGTK